MAKLEARYEEQKIINVEKTKKQSERLEYGEEDDNKSVSEYITFDSEESMNYEKNGEESFNFNNLSDQLVSDSFSSLTFKKDTFLPDWLQSNNI